MLVLGLESISFQRTFVLRQSVSAPKSAPQLPAKRYERKCSEDKEF